MQSLDAAALHAKGKEFFVGLSKRTNDAGARAVADAFPEYPVTPVKVPGKHHLKSLLSIAGPDIICVSASDEAQSVLKVLYKYI
ncbi:hypothetical protein AVEN_142836-1 [Araneus ventricosus]|uniref:Uncharacterized protein n=1 Tax=Araneus ventricosus TaxID=182803 RepID=A0A4Y1ZSZ0_ARAVE|nr:hypothetical protein AVEN_142836-1 [Araneus ventricosus]